MRDLAIFVNMHIKTYYQTNKLMGSQTDLHGNLSSAKRLVPRLDVSMEVSIWETPTC